MTETQNLVHHLLIVDETLETIESRELIYQVNQSIHAIRTEAIRNDHQDHRITLYISSDRGLRCLYASTIAIIAPLIHIENINKLKCKSNIYDAIGVGIGTLKVAAYRAPEAIVNQQVTIFSSARDTASQKYSACNLKSLITLLKNQGWIFSYVGFSEEASQISLSIGIDICCVLKSTPRLESNGSILGIMKRQWVLKNIGPNHRKILGENKIEAA